VIAFRGLAHLKVPLVDGMNAYLAFLLTRFKTAAIVIHEDFAAGSGHVNDSQHYVGAAADFHVAGVPLTEAWLALERFPVFAGVGFYPDWSNPGFHADVRDKRMRERWMRRGTESYVAFDSQALALMLAIEPKLKTRP
jgi:hypothetical protein